MNSFPNPVKATMFIHKSVFDNQPKLLSSCTEEIKDPPDGKQLFGEVIMSQPEGNGEFETGIAFYKHLYLPKWKGNDLPLKIIHPSSKSQ